MDIIPKISTHLWYDREARQAAEFYCSVFPDSRIRNIITLCETPEGTVEVVDFELAGQYFQAISAGPQFRFTEAISLVVRCDTQEELDHYWQSLSAVPEAEQCGWLKDRFGLSWQIVPRAMDAMLSSGDAARIARVTQSFLQMKKFDIAILEAAFEGPSDPTDNSINEDR